MKQTNYSGMKTFTEIVEDMQKNAEEYGDLHGEFCACMMEDPDVCDCDEMKQIHNIVKETSEAVNAWWVAMCKAENNGEPLSRPQAAHLAAKVMGTNHKP